MVMGGMVAQASLSLLFKFLLSMSFTWQEIHADAEDLYRGPMRAKQRTTDRIWTNAEQTSDRGPALDQRGPNYWSELRCDESPRGPRRSQWSSAWSALVQMRFAVLSLVRIGPNTVRVTVPGSPARESSVMAERV